VTGVGIEEPPVPQTTIPREVTAKPQPFPVKPTPLSKNTFHLEEIYDRSREHAQFRNELLAANQMEIGAPYIRRRSKEMRCSCRALWAARVKTPRGSAPASSVGRPTNQRNNRL
jgi:hypothetical protein